jgi:hypothetical protein
LIDGKKFAHLKAITFAFCLLFTFASFSFACAQQNASSAITNAQTKLTSCYDAALAAGKAGANISQLTSTLNAAGTLLSNAEHAYAIGDSEEAQRLATQSQSMLNGFLSETSALENSAMQATTMNFLINIVGSVIGTIAVIAGSIVVWKLLKRKSVTKGEAVAVEHTTV